MKRTIPNLSETVLVRLMPGQREAIERAIRENPERWTYESEFVRAAIYHYIRAFELPLKKVLGKKLHDSSGRHGGPMPNTPGKSDTSPASRVPPVPEGS